MMKEKSKILDAPLFDMPIVKKSYILFDTSWVSFASLKGKAYNWMTCKRNGDGTSYPSGHIFGSLSKILSTLKEYGPLSQTDLIFVFDEKPIETLEIFPEYKAGRNHEFNPIPDVKNMISCLNCFHAHCKNTEADHVIATLAVELAKERQIFIVSADKDLWQLLDNPSISLIPRVNETVNLLEFSKRFELNHPRGVALHKAIFGDCSDNIPKLEGRLERKIISQYIDRSRGTPEDFYEMIESRPTDMKQSTHDILLNNKAQVKKMFEITRLKTNVPYILTENVGSKKELLDFLHGFFIFKADQKIDVLF